MSAPAQHGTATRGVAAVTGATGFLGPHVLSALAGRGWRLRMLARRAPAIEAGPEPVEVVPGDLADPAMLRRLVEGADAIIHLAGTVRARRPADFDAANTEGTARLAETWRQVAPGAHFVLISSMAAREPHLSPYAASKRAGEARLAAIAGEAGGYTILRPAAVYGPGDRETLAVFRAADMAVQPLMNGPAARLCLIHAADVGAAIAAAAASPPGGAVFELSDARHEGYGWAEIAAVAAAALGRTARPLRVPPAVLAALGLAGDAATALGLGTGMLTSAKRREMQHPDWSSRPAAQPPADLWRPVVPLAEGFRQTVSWYRAHGWL
ncbi:NAD-dependent epimerase/dehydratase family protein [Limibaculum sp. FT325]|uniref:NAD-dependent epimerase/dehydratase family protein n=1 Tax=Thermohalobaculum sediminis TaxID=2939436 RepID=UPI0020BF8E2F|nr:NAD-dependent epimerase/dehydratase family protein [Limibaculum sediminis]MCL5775963.1 NAD-dependent epimerase/dehydratase family protein [Limibaculum sediminis]